MSVKRSSGESITVHLKPYKRMKDSGVKWLGAVPSHWKAVRLKSLMTNVVERASTVRQSRLFVALENVESWTGKLDNLEPRFGGSGQNKSFRTGDVLFGKLRPYLAKVTRAQTGGCCVGEFLVLRSRSSEYFDGAYAEQLLRSKLVIDAINSSTYGARMPRAEWSFIGGMRVVRPPLPEQTAIARFLAHATGRIERCIRAKEKRIVLLEEQKRVIVHDAVTGRIDVRTSKPYPAYKSSGVEWLGDVPEHWDVSALRRKYSQCLGKMLDTSRIRGDHLIPYLRNLDVQWDQINVKNLPAMDIAPDEYERYTLRQGDLLVCEGGEVGRCAIWAGELEVCGFQKALHRLRPYDARRDSVQFLCFALRVAVQREAFNDGHLSTIAHLTGEKLRAHRFPFPSTSEQEAIVSFLTAALARCDRSLHGLHRQITVLREYRTRLIADVVTGELDVREAAAELPEVGPYATNVAGDSELDADDAALVGEANVPMGIAS